MRKTMNVHFVVGAFNKTILSGFVPRTRMHARGPYELIDFDSDVCVAVPR